MKLLFYELKKIFSLKIFTICLAVFLAANAAVLCYDESENAAAKQVHDNNVTYNALIEKYGSMDYEDAVKDIEKERLIGEILSAITSASFSDKNVAADIAEQNILAYREAHPQECETAIRLIEEGYDESYYTFITEIAGKLKYISDYEGFIGQMEKRARNKLNFSAFADDAFSKRNILKTPEDFRDLKGVSLKIGNDYFAVQATGFRATDYFLTVLLILLCVALFVGERDRKLFNIVKSTKNGYAPTITAKLSALFISVFAITILFAGENILTAGLYTGFGDVSRNIQSVSEFMNCPFNITILQYLILWSLSKAAAMCAAAAVAAIIFVLIKSNAAGYIIFLLLFAVEYLLYVFIDNNSIFNYFKYLNIFAFLWDNNAIGNYFNLNFFGYPVKYSSVFFISCITVIILANLIAAFLYVKNREFSFGALNTAVSNKVNKITTARFNSVSLFLAENRKHFFKGATAICLIILVALAYSEISSNIKLKYFDPVDNCYAGYMKLLSGEVTEDKEEYMKKEQAFFDGVADEIEKINARTDLTAREKELNTSALSTILQGKGKALELVLSQYEYAESTAQSLGIPPYLIDENIAGILLLDSERDWRHFTLELAAIVVLISGIFTYEYKSGAMPLLRSSKRGRQTLAVSKTAVALITSFISYVLIYLPFMINFAAAYGFDILSYPIASLREFGGINSSMTILQYIIILSLTRIMIFVAATALVILLSVVIKNNMITMLISTAVTLIPCLIFINNDAARLSSLFYSGVWRIAVAVIISSALVLSCIFFITAARRFSGAAAVRKNILQRKIKSADI